jgi:hypothetical protein
MVDGPGEKQAGAVYGKPFDQEDMMMSPTSPRMRKRELQWLEGGEIRRGGGRGEAVHRGNGALATSGGYATVGNARFAPAFSIQHRLCHPSLSVEGAKFNLSSTIIDPRTWTRLLCLRYSHDRSV